jgi:hypothetical protein
MITRSLLVAFAILLFAVPAFPQFGQSNNRLTDVAGRLSREAGEFADQNYSLYVNGARNMRRDIEAVMRTQQFAASARIFYRMVVDRRQIADLRDAFQMLRESADTVERYNLQRGNWNSLQRLMSDISRELATDSSTGGQYPPDTGRGGRMTWKGRVDDDVRIRIRCHTGASLCG